MRTKKDTMFRKLLDVYAEAAREKRALRALAKQEWSLEFLEMLLKKSGQSDVVIKVTTPQGHVLEIQNREKRTEDTGTGYADDILARLDDPVAVNEFLRRGAR